MSVGETIEAKLKARFRPESLEVSDVSARHAGHAGSRLGGETHFEVVLVSAAFAGKSRLQRERAVHAALKEELAGPVHALSLHLKAPGE